MMEWRVLSGVTSPGTRPAQPSPTTLGQTSSSQANRDQDRSSDTSLGAVRSEGGRGVSQWLELC